MSEEVWQRGRLVAEVRSESSETIALLHLDDAHPRVLNGTAARIWVLIDGDRSRAQIITELSEAFDAPVGLIRAQVKGFFMSLADEGLIVPVVRERNPDDAVCKRVFGDE